jgi:hypothetical protein
MSVSHKLDKAVSEINFAINDGNAKQALKLAHSTAKSVGGDDAALTSCGTAGVALLVLKAHALLVLQQWSAADAVAALLLAHSKPLLRERASLRLAVDLLLRRHRAADAVALVEAALALTPTSLDLLADLFAVHVRRRDFKAQHAVAKRLHALSADAKHLRWATLSLCLQSPLALAAPAPAAPLESRPAPAPAALVPLKLAATLMARDVAADSFDAADWLVVYADTLEQLGDSGALVALLRDPRTVRLWHDAVPNERLRRVATALCRARRWRAALATCHALLDADADDWLAWCTALDAVPHVADADLQVDDADAPDAVPSEALARLLARARELQTTHKSVRGPFLVEFEVSRRVDSGRLPAGAAARPRVELLLAYFEAFGDKACYASDVVPFVRGGGDGAPAAAWAGEFLAALEQRLERAAPHSGKIEPGDGELVRRCVRWATQWSSLGLLREQLEAAPSDEQLIERAAADVARFSTTVAWALPYEHRESPQAGDTLALLAARALLRLSMRRDAGSSERLLHRVHAAALLQSALRRSEFNFQFKLQLVVAYDALAAYQPVHRLRGDLELNYVQCESLSYLFYEPAIASAMGREADEIADKIVGYHTESRKSVPERVFDCYALGAYSRVRDVMSFDDRLSRSQQLAVVRAERALQRVVGAGGQHAAVQAALDAAFGGHESDTLVCETAEQAAALVSNEDVASVAELFLCGRSYAAFSGAAVVGLSSAERRLWLRLRWSLLRALQQALGDAAAAPAVDAADAILRELRPSEHARLVVSAVAAPTAQYALAIDSVRLAQQCKAVLAAAAPDEAALTALGEAVRALAARCTALSDEFVRLCSAERVLALCDAVPALQLGATVTTRFVALLADVARRAAPPRRAKAHGKLWGAIRAAAAAIDEWRAALASDAKRVHDALLHAVTVVDASSLPASDAAQVARSAQVAAALGDAGAVLDAWTSVRASHSVALSNLAALWHETARCSAEPMGAVTQ